MASSRAVSGGQGRLAAALVAAVLVLLGVTHVGLGLLMAVSPGRFFEQIASYGTQNDHYIRDVSTFYLAMGVVQLAAVRRAPWRLPVLAFTALQYALHVLNHVLDVGDTDPGWMGPVNLLSIAGLAVLIVLALRWTAKGRP